MGVGWEVCELVEERVIPGDPFWVRGKEGPGAGPCRCSSILELQKPAVAVGLKDVSCPLLLALDSSRSREFWNY